MGAASARFLLIREVVARGTPLLLTLSLLACGGCISDRSIRQGVGGGFAALGVVAAVAALSGPELSCDELTGECDPLDVEEADDDDDAKVRLAALGIGVASVTVGAAIFSHRPRRKGPPPHGGLPSTRRPPAQAAQAFERHALVDPALRGLVREGVDEGPAPACLAVKREDHCPPPESKSEPEPAN